MAAALATLDFVDRHPVAEHVWAMGEQLISGLNAAAHRHQIPALACGEPLPPMPFLKFTIPDARINERVKTAFYRTVFNGGVLLHPRHLWFVSYAHTAEDIAHTLEVCERAFGAARLVLQAESE